MQCGCQLSGEIVMSQAVLDHLVNNLYWAENIVFHCPSIHTDDLAGDVACNIAIVLVLMRFNL